MTLPRLEKILQEKKVRVTPFRLAVLEIVANHDSALSVPQIEEQLGDFDRVTLYRTIKTFTDSGVVHEIALPGLDKKIALCDHDCHLEQETHTHQHAHFKCTSCGEVYCVELSTFPKVQLKGFEVSTVDLTVTGKCERCSKG